jgi:8-oxo-dGTP pyrophosphatase MutT (NUDIX family)
LQRKRKAAVYVISHRGLLVFSHTCHPEAGLQVPSGTIEEHEDPLAAAVRELEEEAGIKTTPDRLEPLPVYTHDMRPFRSEIQERYPFRLGLDAIVEDSWTHWEEHPDLVGAEPERFDFHWEPLDRALPQRLAIGQGHPVAELCSSHPPAARERLEYRAPRTAVREWAAARRHRMAQAITILFPHLGTDFPAGAEDDRVLGALLEHAAFLARHAANSGRQPLEAEELCVTAFAAAANSSRRVLVVDSKYCLEVASGTYETPLLACTASALDMGLEIARPDYMAAIAFLKRAGFSFPLDPGLAVVVELGRKALLEATNSYTLSGLAGTIYCDRVPSQVRLAETLLHESLHNWLNMAFAVFQPAGFDSELYWSPWRHKLRPAQGLIQGTFVFSILCQFFDQCLKADDIDPVDQAYAAARLRTEVAVLRRHLEALSAPLAQVTNLELRSLLFEELNRAVNLRPDLWETRHDARVETAPK